MTENEKTVWAVIYSGCIAASIVLLLWLLFNLFGFNGLLFGLAIWFALIACLVNDFVAWNEEQEVKLDKLQKSVEAEFASYNERGDNA